MVAKVVLACCFCLLTLNSYGQVYDVPHQSDLPTRTLLVPVQNPKAVVLLFPGGGGMPRIADDGSVRSRHTFVRSLNLWAQYQIDAVLVDSPYDLGDLRRGDLRSRKDHLDRVAEVIAYYKNKFGVPVWIFGHSMGSSTATNFVNQISPSPGQLQGIIIAGTIRTAYVDDAVTLPVLAIHHIQDSCLGSLPESAVRIINARPKNTVSRLALIKGGISEGDACESFAYHGFNQTEPEFINKAAQFILSQ